MSMPAMMAFGWLLVLFQLVSLVRAEGDSPYVFSEEYDSGGRGAYPHKSYKSSPHTSPELNYLQYNPLCDDGRYIMLAPRGTVVHQPGPMILDSRGNLVWYHDYGHTYGLDVHTFKGEQYLTFWSGYDGVVGHGVGNYLLLDSSYREAYKVEGGNGLRGDLHEFHITLDETAVFTIYNVVPADLTAVDGPEDGWLWDSSFQEVDIESGEVLFQWSASDHYDFSEINRGREGNGETEDHAWDFFHINSVDKDPKGNFLISSRYMGSLTYIDGQTGDIIWKLGGQDNRFEDLSDGAATNMTWQHHARFRDNGTSITLFDNQSRGAGAPELPSRGLHIDIDTDKMTASVRNSYWGPQGHSSQSQGSLQIIEDEDKAIVGYGYIAAWTEFTIDGEVLCDVHFGPESSFGDGTVISYRAFKRDWVGRPPTIPDIVVESNTAYVSWNGATEVATWMLQGAESEGADDEEFEFLAAVVKDGFETEIQVPKDAHPFIRATALDSDGATLASTKTLSSNLTGDDNDDDDLEDTTELPQEEESEITPGARIKSYIRNPVFSFVFGFIAAAVVAGCAFCVFAKSRCLRLRRRGTVENDKDGWQPVELEENISLADYSDHEVFSDEETDPSKSMQSSDETERSGN